MPKDLLDAMHGVLMAEVKLSWQSLHFFLGSHTQPPKESCLIDNVLQASKKRHCNMVRLE